MVANTNRLARLTRLCGTAISLVTSGNRTDEQIDKLLNALQWFKQQPSAKPREQQRPDKWVYPGRNGNRCSRCGGYIDEGGICNCRIDHDNQVQL